MCLLDSGRIYDRQSRRGRESVLFAYQAQGAFVNARAGKRDCPRRKPEIPTAR
jgi:hypothetical protein